METDWGQCYLAGEGLEQRGGDRSGGLHIINGMEWTTVPRVAQARLYESARGWISAVYSYPHGIGIMPDYFWEIFSPDLLDEVERFTTEAEMEQRVRELLDDERHMAMLDQSDSQALREAEAADEDEASSGGEGAG